MFDLPFKILNLYKDLIKKTLFLKKFLKKKKPYVFSFFNKRHKHFRSSQKNLFPQTSKTQKKKPPLLKKNKTNFFSKTFCFLKLNKTSPKTLSIIYLELLNFKKLLINKRL